MLHDPDTDESDDETFERDGSASDYHPHGGARRYQRHTEKHRHNSAHYRRHYRKNHPHGQPRSRSSSTPQVLPDGPNISVAPPENSTQDDSTLGIPSIYVSPAGTNRKSEVLGKIKNLFSQRLIFARL